MTAASSVRTGPTGGIVHRPLAQARRRTRGRRRVGNRGDHAQPPAIICPMMYVARERDRMSTLERRGALATLRVRVRDDRNTPDVAANEAPTDLKSTLDTTGARR
jgi:hypothetical protein